jgi:hypothetical protein
METRSISARPDVAVATTTARVTPTPPRASRFGEVLSNTVVRSAESAMSVLPGSPVMAVAVRGAGGASALGVPMKSTAPTTTMSATGGSPEGPLAAAGPRITPGGMNLTAPGIGSAIPGAGGTSETSGVEASLQRSQEMNLSYLAIQEEVNAQNRMFTTYSNLMKTEHDTVKTAIGNIR